MGIPILVLEIKTTKFNIMVDGVGSVLEVLILGPPLKRQWGIQFLRISEDSINISIYVIT